MKRRDFLVRSAGAALLGALPAAMASNLRGPLLDDPAAWIGTTFRTTGGARLTLAAVEQLGGDRHTTQLRLQFRVLTGDAPGEGTHVLASGWSEQALFLQCGREGPVACLNRLRGLG